MKSYKRLLGRIDQEVIHDTGPVETEFYRFHKGSVLLLGYLNRYPNDHLIKYDPPVTLLPHGIDTVSEMISTESTTSSIRMEPESVSEKMNTKFKIKKIENGFIELNGLLIPGFLCYMTISRDQTVEFAGKNLILPDAIQIKSKVLIGKNTGPVLEWTVKMNSVKPEDEEHDKDFSEKNHLNGNKLYIELTIHNKK